jgi:gamma-glutamyl-gamma-aminobutyrate hydrolase PuuD
VVLPPLANTLDDLGETLARFDGVCLPGGPDVDPHRYGAAVVDPRVDGVDPDHDALDLAMARAAVEAGLPLLAICRGHEVLNVALGGTLVQHMTTTAMCTTPSASPRVHERRLPLATNTRSVTRFTTRPSTALVTGWLPAAGPPTER